MHHNVWQNGCDAPNRCWIYQRTRMICQHDIRLAIADDADCIARMSRDFIEYGLGWRWTAERINKCMQDAATNVAVVDNGERLSAFAIMEYQEECGHLLLLAVDAIDRQRGVATALMRWHEQVALTAGISTIFLEARTRNTAARAFYKKLGYSEVRVDKGFYRGHEDGVRLSRNLRVPA
jgi:ribosomal protein S18 acetylase RimI-like enzyme